MTFTPMIRIAPAIKITPVIRIRRLIGGSSERLRPRAKPAHLAVMLCALLSGCASFLPDGGMTTVADITGKTINKDVVAIRTTADAQSASDTVRRLVSRSLTVDAAVQIALLNNRGLQASYSAPEPAESDPVT